MAERLNTPCLLAGFGPTCNASTRWTLGSRLCVGRMSAASLEIVIGFWTDNTCAACSGYVLGKPARLEDERDLDRGVLVDLATCEGYQIAYSTATFVPF